MNLIVEDVESSLGHSVGKLDMSITQNIFRRDVYILPSGALSRETSERPSDILSDTYTVITLKLLFAFSRDQLHEKKSS